MITTILQNIEPILQTFNLNGQINSDQINRHLDTLTDEQSVRTDLAKIHQEGNILKVFGNCLRIWLLFDKLLNPIWTFLMHLDAFSL